MSVTKSECQSPLHTVSLMVWRRQLWRAQCTHTDDTSLTVVEDAEAAALVESIHAVEVTADVLAHALLDVVPVGWQARCH